MSEINNTAQNDLNWINTGGSFGKTRRCPTFTIILHETGNYIARDDLCPRNAIYAVAPSLYELEQLLKVECNRRTFMG